MKTNFLFVFLLFGAFKIGAQPSFSLQDALNYAGANHAKVRMADMDVDDAKHQIRETAAIGIPQVNGEIQYTHYLKLKPGLVPEAFFDPMGDPNQLQKLPAFGAKNNFAFGATLSSLVFDFSYIIGLKAAKKFKDLTLKQKDLTVQQVKNNVREAYIATFIVQVTEGTLEKNISNLEQTLFETKELYKNGFVEQLDVDRLELSLSVLRADLRKLNNQKSVLANVLKFQMGFPIEQEFVLTDDLDKLVEAALVDEIMDKRTDFSSRRELDVLDRQIMLNEDNVKRLRAGYLPNLAVFANFTEYLEGNRLLKSDERFFSYSSFLGFQINVPLFDGFEKKNAIARAQINLDKIFINREEALRGFKLELENARVDYSNAVENLTSTKQTLELAEKIYDTTQIKYKAGVGSSQEIRQAELDLYRAQADYNNSTYELLVAKTAIDKALGK